MIKKIALIAFIILQYNSFSQELFKSISDHSEHYFSVTFSPDGQTLASGGKDKTIKLWDFNTGSLIKKILAHRDWINSLCFSSDGKTIASGSSDNTIKLWDVNTGNLVKNFLGHKRTVNSVSISTDDEILASGGYDNSLKLWEVSSGDLIKTIIGKSEWFYTVCFSPDGKTIASGSNDNTIKLWDVNTGGLLQAFSGHSSYINSVSFSPDGRMLASGSLDRTIILWEINTGNLLKTLSGHSDIITSVSFSPDGRMLASGSTDKTIILWDVKTGSLIKKLSGHLGVVSSVSFSPNGRMLASCSSDKTIKLWNVSKLDITNQGVVINVKNKPINKLPPILRIEDIVFSTGVLVANETAKLNVTIKNIGPGNADNVYVELYSDNNFLSYIPKTEINKIKGDGDSATIAIDITALRKIESGETYLDINVTEPNFSVKVQGKRIVFNTREFKKPVLTLAKFAVIENLSSSPNNQIDINEMIDVKFAVQNVGEGVGEDLKIKLTNNQIGVMLLGIAEGNNLVQKSEVIINKLEPGAFESVTYRYFVNSDFIEKQINFSISCSEKYSEYGFTENKLVDINTTLKEEGRLIQVAFDNNEPEKEVVIENIPDLTIDVREKIPETMIINNDAVAVIIGNKNYKRKDIPSVEYATEDAMIMKQYLINTLGYREGNIIYTTNAAQGDFISIFGSKDNYKGKLYNYVREGKSDVFIYYSGHGAPDPESKQGYFVPVDCDPSLVTLNGYSLNTFYENLSKINYKSLTVVIDACFSGSSDKGTLLKNISPVFITVENPFISKENTTVFTSASGDQVSSWYPEKKHSLFTYFFLKGLKGDADLNTDKTITIGEMKNYIMDNVPYMARRLNNREQTPQVVGDDNEILIQY